MGHKLTVRNCHPQDPGDAAAYEQLRQGAVFVHLLSRPDYQVDKNLFFAEIEGAVAGCTNVLPELGIGRVILEYGVNPAHELEAVLGELLECALATAEKLGAEVAHVSIPLDDTRQVKAISNLGFTAVRRFSEMRMDISGVNLVAAAESDWTYRCLEAGEEELLAHIQNRCFAGTWGFNPNTVDYVKWEMKVKSNCLEDIILALDEGEIIGYCWTESECGRDASTDKRKGRVYMLGVDADFRAGA